MDEDDFRILAFLVRDPTASLAAAARALGLSRSGVQERYARLREGPLEGFEVFPNPALWDRVAVLAAYAPPPRPPQPVARVLETDDVVGYSVNHDGQIAVTYLAQRPDTPPPPALDRLLGGPPARTFLRATPPLRPPGAALSRLQWRILEGLMDDARIPSAELGRRAGVDARTAARQREALRRGGAYRILPGVLANRAEGIVLFHLYLQGPATAKPEDVLRSTGIRWWAVLERTEAPPGVFVLCHAAALGDALAARDRIAATPGVDHVELVLEREGAMAVARLKAMCREGAGAVGRPGREAG